MAERMNAEHGLVDAWTAELPSRCKASELGGAVDLGAARLLASPTQA